MTRILFHTETGNFLLTAASRPGLGPIQPPFQWALFVSTEVKQLLHNRYHLGISNAEVNNVRGFTTPSEYRPEGQGNLCLEHAIA